jgi:hypothetical protein
MLAAISVAGKLELGPPRRQINGVANTLSWHQIVCHKSNYLNFRLPNTSFLRFQLMEQLCRTETLSELCSFGITADSRAINSLKMK